MKYWSLTILLFLFFGASAQNTKELAQAKADYKNGAFGKALPVFEREYNAKPNDASLNLWYGVCLVETGGDLKKAEECLLIASKRNLPESYLYLGDLYIKEYRIQIIDSLIVDKQSLLSAYKLSPEVGSLSRYQDVFESKGNVESVVYMNEKGSKIYFGEPSKSKYTLYSMDKLLSGYGNKKALSADNFGLDGDANYPFVLTDGSTIYFSAKDDNGLGGYDIYVTRYNFNNDSFLTPELLNMPFNSPANDYLYVFDEEKGVGWFATDRFQPEGKVCIYTFIPNEEVKLVESDDDKYIESRARITSIRNTWQPGKDYRSIREKAKKEVAKVETKSIDFTFIVDDSRIYHFYSDFKSTKARTMFQDLQSKQKSLDILNDNLETKRFDYSKASAAQKKSLSAIIVDLEKSQEQLMKTISDLEVNTRNEEIKVNHN
ncbi:MAG: tetratricopeptide repeat protein [Dysgonomonas sp.]|uniref:tetratricopeptide repeat protein n=1 Tax=Dysgonomonas sp. TaxID=1891233 RepID=UPI00257CF51C|nr:tetratricopeptide repeat protein [Dysgonomonas sp.]MBS7120100.1 tetratricopeptide repeat protein [Dysgonomonas sp.]